MDRILFVGPGRMGLALGEALLQSGAARELTYSGRNPEPPSHPLFNDGSARYVWGLDRPAEGTTAVFLSVPDQALEEVAHTLAARGDAPPGCAAFHLSGAVAADPLAPLHARGYSVGTLHPIQSIANPITGAARLHGCGYALSGEPDAVAVGRRLVAALGGRTVRVPAARRPLYHAAAALASNYLVVLVDRAARVMEDAGLEREEALAVLLPLARGTLDNVRELGPETALTGPVARGDAETVAVHLRSLSPSDRTLYAHLALGALEMAADRVPEETRRELAAILEAER